MRWGCSAIAFVGLVGMAGCHSKYVEATITNRSDAPLQVVQVEYPSATFGVQALKPGETFRYRFKLLGSGPVKITYTDAKKKEHKQTGPHMNEGEEGQLTIVFPSQDKAEFQTSLHP